jgi:translation initiation factor IF-1
LIGETASHHTGVIEEVLPNGMYRVRLEDGRKVRVGLSAAARHAVVRLISGSPVEVKLSAVDPNRGQITKQL